MSNNREKDLWRELDRRDILMAFLVTAFLIIIYHVIGWTRPSEESIWSIIRTFALDTIVNLIPVFLLYIGVRVLFRHTQALRTEKETEELASKVANNVKSELGALREAAKADQAAAIEERSLIIKSAKYGAEGHYNDVTDRVKSAIAAGKVKMRVDDDVFGPDPIKKVPKKVTVDYVYAGREGYSKTVPQNADLIFSTLK